MRIKWKVWNADRACPVGEGFAKFKAAIAAASLAEAVSGEHYTVIPA